ncbi:iron chelate uptake ABC transporter family permease subunit [Bacillus wiedmannii]|uniref:FecCD family ABC transporter permease n=1 Tax=Bacillus wiedmannii TaxID=1890302 RepID=UPI002E1FFA36|nr:iron chelate uptake ABC transporter family permease subunit [Bacillus wiedmannii]
MVSVSNQRYKKSFDKRGIKNLMILSILVIITICLGIINIGLGDISFTPSDILYSLFEYGDSDTRSIIMEYRMPRILLAMIAGMGLSISGVIAQAVLRNPLASPDTIGISSGAGLGAVIVTLFFPESTMGILASAALFGGVFAAFVVYILSYNKGINPIKLTLIGVTVSTFFSSGIQLFISKANPNIHSALIWLNGSLWGRTWLQVQEVFLWIVILMPVSWILARHMDVMNIGDHVATGVGISVEKKRLLLLIITVGMTAAAVSVVGTISFIGLISPHMGRKLVGPRHSILIPTAGLLGAALLVMADCIGRGLLPPLEIPVGLVISSIGAPFFLYLMWREKN